jgi:hypothetical protein
MRYECHYVYKIPSKSKAYFDFGGTVHSNYIKFEKSFSKDQMEVLIQMITIDIGNNLHEIA